MLDQNVTQELAREAAELLSIADASDIRSLHRLAVLAARQVPACSGATSALWRDGEPVEMAATHPDLADLFELAWNKRTGPWATALAAGEVVTSADSLTEERWPEYASAALCRGVRCSVTLVHQFGPMTLMLSLFGARPRSLDLERVALAELLVAFGGATMGNASIYGDSQRTALQLREAAESRTLVDQAKGILDARPRLQRTGSLRPDAADVSDPAHKGDRSRQDHHQGAPVGQRPGTTARGRPGTAVHRTPACAAAR